MTLSLYRIAGFIAVLASVILMENALHVLRMTKLHGVKRELVIWGEVTKAVQIVRLKI